MHDLFVLLAQHGTAVVALIAAVRSVLRSRALKDAAVAESTKRLLAVHKDTEHRLAASEGRERGLKFRCAELENRVVAAEKRATAMKREFDKLHDDVRRMS